ncbi:MAG: hypothetical protein GXY89_04970, partial [Tissierellia bacterium]|nr:hypothetical protein [Tissierellia bacterium]
KSLVKTIANSVIVILTVRILYSLNPSNPMLIVCILSAVTAYMYLGIKSDIIDKEDIKGIFKRK